LTNVIEVDFAGAPPAQGGGSDHIPRGRYVLRIVSADKTKAKSGRDMVAVRFTVDGGQEDGARERDQFVLPRSKDDSRFGLQRFNAFLEAVGYNIGERKVRLDLDNLVNRLIEADVVDDKYEPENGSPRIISRMDAYYRVRQGSPDAASVPSSNGAAPPPADEPDVADDIDEMVDGVDEPATEPEPVSAAPAHAAASRRPAQRPAQRAQEKELDQAETDAEDLFA